jgi:hypothetical protein
MDPRILRDIMRRLSRVEARSARLRYGVITATSPLTVKLGNAATDYPDVRQLDTGALSVADNVAVLVRGNDLLVLGRVV